MVALAYMLMVQSKPLSYLPQRQALKESQPDNFPVGAVRNPFQGLAHLPPFLFCPDIGARRRLLTGRLQRALSARVAGFRSIEPLESSGRLPPPRSPISYGVQAEMPNNFPDPSL